MMSAPRLALIVFVAALCAAPASASRIDINSQVAYGTLYFDLTPGGIAVFDTTLGPDEIVLESPIGDLRVLEARMAGGTGPLQSLVRNRNQAPFQDYDEYTYAAGGHLLVEFDFELPTGTLHTMSLQGDLPGLFVRTFDDHGEIESMSFGATIDKASAKILGWDPRFGVTFSFDWWLMDFNDGDFDEDYREGQHFGDYSISGTDAVPEPALLTLLPLGLAALARRRAA